VPEADRRTPTPLSGPLARLDRGREELAKAWLVRLIERASLEGIKNLPIDRIAGELPQLISDVLRAAGADGELGELAPEVQERASRLAELRDVRDLAASELTRDVTAIQSVILEALGREASELGIERFAALTAAVAEAVGAVHAAAIETLVARRSRELESLASNDAPTGLPNLRHLQRELGHALRLHERYSQPFALLVLDVDGLGRINDSRGRAAGDRLLVGVALAMRRAVRSVDVPARIGGDEFCVLAPTQTAAAARPLAQRLAEAVPAETAVADEPGIAVAVGVVSCPEHGTEPDALLDAADRAMYRARAAGEDVALGEAGQPEITVERTR